MLKASIEKEVDRLSKAPRAAFGIAFKAARWIPSRLVKKLLFRRVHASARRQASGVSVLGGAPLEPEVAEFFDRLGLPIYQGYGLTETSPVVAVNTPRSNRVNSVGRPLPGRARSDTRGRRAGRRRRDFDIRPSRDEGVLRAGRPHARGDRRARLVSHGRPGQARPKTVSLHHRAVEEPDRSGQRQESEPGGG